MKKMLQIKLMMIFMLTLMIGVNGLLFPESKPKSKIRFFSPGSFYIYVMGSYNHFSPLWEHFLELGPDSSDAFAPVLGIGYRVVNIRDRLFFCLEGDYSPATYNFGEFAREQKINTLTFMLNVERRVASKKFPVVIFAGVGVVIHQLPDLGYVDLVGDFIPADDDTIIAFAWDIGIKIPISRSFFIRSEYQWNGDVYGDYVYYDEYDELDDTRWDFLSSSLSVGLEFHF
ncbi:MAG: hypothetical protein PVH61_15345 [Candidatus Aminicenantes bacterium]|jgi:hypothetical protein